MKHTQLKPIEKWIFSTLSFVISFVITLFVFTQQMDEILARASGNHFEETNAVVGFLNKYKDLIFFVFAIGLYLLDTNGVFERFKSGSKLCRSATLFFAAIPATWIINDAFQFTNFINYALLLFAIIFLIIAVGLAISDRMDKSKRTAESKALNERISNHDDIIVRINEVKKHQADQAANETDGIDDVVIVDKDKKPVYHCITNIRFDELQVSPNDKQPVEMVDGLNTLPLEK